MSTKKKKKKIKTLLIPENTLVKSTKNTNNPPVHQIYQISISWTNDAVTTGNLTNPASHATLHNRTLQKTLDRSITGAQQDWGAAAMPEPLILHRRWFEVNTNISTLSLIMTMLSCQMFAS